MKRLLCSLFMLACLQTANAQRKYVKSENGPQKIEMTTVTGGTFKMGSNKEEKDRRPAHKVTLRDFTISTYEITQEQWQAVMGNNPSSEICGKCPVNNVSWDDVQAFIQKLNSMAGRHYRLPTEAEWEYAARGGQMEQPGRYSGKNLLQTIAWYEGNSKSRIHEIGMKRPNELGIYDMSGNVAEWCFDFYAPGYGITGDADNPQGPADGKSHVVRGGSWTTDADDMVVTSRAAFLSGTRSASAGFRLVE